MFPLDVELVHLRNRGIGALPSLKHNLSEIGLRRCLSIGPTQLLHPVGRPIVAADLALRALFRRFR
jgi:hypothetical protein